LPHHQPQTFDTLFGDDSGDDMVPVVNGVHQRALTRASTRVLNQWRFAYPISSASAALASSKSG
jgi:hypothetical protein